MLLLVIVRLSGKACAGKHQGYIDVFKYALCMSQHRIFRQTDSTSPPSVYPLGGLVLDDNYQGPGGGVIAWLYHDGVSQQWIYDTATQRLVSHLGLCLEVTGALTAPGSPVYMYACGTAADQQWQFQPDGSIRPNHAPNMCLALSTAVHSLATLVIVACQLRVTPYTQWDIAGAHKERALGGWARLSHPEAYQLRGFVCGHQRPHSTW